MRNGFSAAVISKATRSADDPVRQPSGPTIVVCAPASFDRLRFAASCGGGSDAGSRSASVRLGLLRAPGDSGWPLPTLLPRRDTGELISFGGM
jgi:hypothetical protein